jgi:hypothetical protein
MRRCSDSKYPHISLMKWFTTWESRDIIRINGELLRAAGVEAEVAVVGVKG